MFPWLEEEKQLEEMDTVESQVAVFLFFYSLESEKAEIFLASFIFIKLIANYLYILIVVTYWIIATG